MSISGRRVLRASAFSWAAWAGSAWGGPPYAVLLEKYHEEIREHPQDYLERSERAYFMLENGHPEEPVGEDLDTLLSHSVWRTEGERLLAMRLRLMGRLEEARALIQKNIRANVHVQEQARLLADIELSRGDTAAAIQAHRLAWDQHQDETDYVALLGLSRAHGAPPPDELLERGLRLYPSSPGALEYIFEAYFASGDAAGLGKAIEISGRAEKTLWPRSVDWKIRHARALLALQRPGEAKGVLVSALELLDGESRLSGESGQAFRREIFSLLEATGK